MGDSGISKVEPKAHSKPSLQRASAPADRAYLGSGAGLPPVQEAAGNLAVQGLLRSGALRPKLAVSQPDDPDEQDAERKSAEFVRSWQPSGVRTAPPRRIPASDSTAPAIGGSVGLALPPSLRSPYESFFQTDFSAVRVHTDPAAEVAAGAIKANAFALGSNIYFGRDRFEPRSASGRALLAHELAHVVQAPRDGAAIRSDNGPGTTDTGTPDVGKTVAKTPDTPVPDEVDEPVEVLGAELGPDRFKDDNKQKFVVHSHVVQPPLALRYYAIPVAKLRKTPVDQGTTVPPPVVAPPPGASSTVEHPAGSTVTTIDGEKLAILASTPDHVIVGEYNKYAVGAASTSALKLEDGTVIVIDAGVNAKNLGITERALGDLTLQKLAEFIGDKPIHEFLISHAHADHTSLAPEILRRFPVDTIRINSVQARWPKYKELRKAMVDAQGERLKALQDKFAERLAKDRLAWEATQPSVADFGAKETRWNHHVLQEFLEQAKTMPGAQGAVERILVQSKDGLDLADVNLATGEKLGKIPLDATDKPPAFDEEGIFSVRETQRPIGSKRVLDQRRNTRDADIDKNASAYVISLKTGLRLLVLPDLRANDLKALMTNFEAAATPLGVEPRIQIWDASHHMQKGWYQGAVPASQLQKVVDFLTAYRTKKGTDVVVVSAEADLRNPNAKTLIDPANLWLLRAMGFEAYLATSGQDVRVYDITTSQGRQLTGVAAPKAPGKGPPSATIARAKLALEQLRADRQTQRAALAEETDPAKQAAIRSKLDGIDKLLGEIDAAYQECLAEIPKKFQAPEKGHTTQTISDAGQGDFPKMAALDKLLEQHHFDVPITSDAHLTPVALVILGQAPPSGVDPAPDSSPQGRARQLARLRSDIAEIGVRIHNGEVTEALHAELMLKLQEYRAFLQNELSPANRGQKPIQSVSEQLLSDDLASVEAKIDGLQEAKSTISYKRVAGQVIEQHTVVLKQMPREPSAAAKATQAGLEVVGRGMGLVMVISTVTGEGDLMRRWQEGSANKAEVAVGSVHNLIAGAVALKMLRGVPVANEVFVVLAVLEISEAALADYVSDEQRNIAIAYSAVSAALNLALMTIGGAMMLNVEFPPVAVVGFLLTMAGPTILEALGVHDWLERRLEFDPGSVTEVKQTLRKLMVKYSEITGAIRLEKRARDAADHSVVSNRADLIAQADQSIDRYRFDAVGLEEDILDAFADGYDEASTSYAGLKELDDYRAQFLTNRFNAGMEGYSGTRSHWYGDSERTAQTRLEVEQRFDEFEHSLRLNDLSPDEILEMPQWNALDDGEDKLRDLINDTSSSDYHEDVRKQDVKVKAMIDNARYRLDPTSQGDERTEAMLDQGSPSRAAYEAEMTKREVIFSQLHNDYIQRTRVICGFNASAAPASASADPEVRNCTLQVEGVLSMAEASARMFRLMAETEIAPPRDIADAMFRSAEDGERYRQYVKADDGYARELQRLETTEGMILAEITQAKRILAPVAGKADAQEYVDRAEKAAGLMKEAYGIRFYKRGIVYVSELDGLRLQVKADEVKNMTALFEKPGRSTPLSPEELGVLNDDSHYGAPGEKVVPPIATRLSVIPKLTEINPDGTMASIFRLIGKEIFMDVRADFTGVAQFDVPPSKRAIVGAAARYQVESDVTYVRVLPLNDDAIEAFGGYTDAYAVISTSLVPVTGDELLKNAPGRPK
jgi:hypothetical protein